MTQHAILTAIGTDRPGLVDEVSQFIFERGGNIEDSRMVNLRGQFAMMVLVSGPADAVGKIGQEIETLSRQVDLQTDFRPAGPDRPAAGQAMPYRLVATTLDQSGLVHRIAHLLRSMNINIESLDTHLEPAPYTGAPMFNMELILSIPRPTSLAKVKQELARICDELNIDWDLSPM